MPELPEVETIAKGAHARLRGDCIEDTWFSEKREPFQTAAQSMSEALRGQQIRRVHRVGKHIVFDLFRDPAEEVRRGGKGRQEDEAFHLQWIVHLGMTGRLLVAQQNEAVAPHTHGILRLKSGLELRFVDPRRFGRLSIRIAGQDGDRGFQGPGREPLDVSAEEFLALFRKRHTSIKAALLNQRLLHGVGNIYADESLFRAGIRPGRMAARLKRAEFLALHENLKAVLREAIARGGSSVSDYVNAEGAKGLFQLEHRVYMRTGQPCVKCGEAIRRTVLSGRGTHYCPKCQR